MRMLLTCAVVLLFSVTATSSTTTTIEGSLTTESGAPIRGAMVLVHDFSALGSQATYVSQNWEARTGDDGLFSFKVQSGCYDFFVSATWFLPHSGRVCVQDGHSAKLKLKMKADGHVMLREE